MGGIYQRTERRAAISHINIREQILEILIPSDRRGVRDEKENASSGDLGGGKKNNFPVSGKSRLVVKPFRISLVED